MQDHVEWYAVRRSHTHPREAELPHEAQKAADCGAYCGILSGFSKQLCSIVLNSTWTKIQLSLKREVRDTRTQGYLSLGWGTNFLAFGSLPKRAQAGKLLAHKFHTLLCTHTLIAAQTA